MNDSTWYFDGEMSNVVRYVPGTRTGRHCWYVYIRGFDPEPVLRVRDLGTARAAAKDFIHKELGYTSIAAYAAAVDSLESYS